MSQQRHPTLGQRLTSPVLMWLIIIAGGALVFHFVPARQIFHRSVISIIVFMLAAVNWLYFFASVLAVHRAAPRSAAAITHLVTTGVYAKVRHPIYSADILLAWSIFLIFPRLDFLVSVIWLTLVMAVWMKLEESALIAKFGAEYEHYKSTTPMVIPRYIRTR